MTDQTYDLLRRPEVERRTGLSTTSLYAMMGRGEFPRPVRISVRAVAWPTRAVDDWIRTRRQAKAA